MARQLMIVSPDAIERLGNKCWVVCLLTEFDCALERLLDALLLLYSSEPLFEQCPCKRVANLRALICA
eukprot:2814867-Prymnesium_polylepis.1